MSKEDFYILLMQSRLLLNRSVILSLFTILEKRPEPIRFNGGHIVVNDNVTFLIDNKEYILPWWTEGHPLYRYTDEINIKANTLPNIKNDVTTTYGRLLANKLLLLENLDDTLDYMNGNWIKDGIIHRVMDRIANDVDITGEQAHSFVNSLQFIASLTQICVPSATEKSMTTDPRIKKRKRELLEMYKDRLDDPAIISIIEQELVAMDREWLKEDLAEGFYKSGKDYNVSRKRMFIMHGGEKSFIDDTRIDMINFSLDDGWDLKELPKVANSLRDGAYGRGAATAMGGERVKKFQQTFQNSRISMKDCGTKGYADFIINKYNKKQFLGRYTKDGDIVTEHMASNSVGKKMSIRTPLYCKAPKTDYCEMCSGMSMEEQENSVNMLTASIGSVFMLIEMKATHGKELLTATYDIENCLN